MSKGSNLAHCICFFQLLVVAVTLPAAENAFVPIFDGESLEGWEGDRRLWSVQEGAITGQTTAEDPIETNTFLIWRAGKVADFELKLQYKIIGGNSGIQYRSFEIPDQKWVVGGYQGDFEAGDRYSGILYGERFRGILADRGQKTVIHEGGRVEVVGSVGDSDAIQAKIRKEDWNEYHITARGNHFTHSINGVVTCEATDRDSAARAEGIVALQLHRGPPMKVQFREVMLKRLDPEVAAAPPAVSHSARDAVAQLRVHPDLRVQLFAAEPTMFNPTNIDVDHLGRVWVCEVLNYRRFRNTQFPERTEGDRILVLEDTDGDGKANRSTTFYQGRDIDSVHGICLLPSSDGSNLRALVSAKDSVFYLMDDDGDLRADRKEVLFTGISGTEHDHGIHAFVFGADGKLYFNFGNEGKQLKRAGGEPVIDLAGNEVNDSRNPYQQGMLFRCNLDGSQFETLGWNFRNNWEVAVDSFGNLWQSDNDDDGNFGVRINFVMEFGNYGYRDELTGASWQEERTNMHPEIPLRHWHLNDPGVVPNLLQTGAGSPTGICVYEGDLLPAVFHGEVIHCDAGPNIVRAYPVQEKGAGYTAGTVNILDGAANQWFRPSDVCVAPDGSLIVADWYDAGVGGHRMEDVEHGRLFRVIPRDHDGRYLSPPVDLETIDGAIHALQSPNRVVRALAWTRLHRAGDDARDALDDLLRSTQNPRLQARALWLLGKIKDRGAEYVQRAIQDPHPDLRVVGIRMARQLCLDVVPIVQSMADDESAKVRRELAIALRHNRSAAAPQLWAALAEQHDGYDRWYLEALGIAADAQWDRFLAAWLDRVGDQWNTPAGRDIIWRSRATQTPAYLARIVKHEDTPPETLPRYFRAFDFLSGPEKQKALESILE